MAPMPVVKPLTDRGYRALWSMRLARKAGCCMPPPDRPELLLHKARQDELVVERLLADRAGHEETDVFPTSTFSIGDDLLG